MSEVYKNTLVKLKEMMFRSETKIKHNIDLVDKIVSIYSITQKNKEDKILPFEKSVLIYYLLHGFNKESKELIKQKLKKNENQINTTNTNLRNKGYLFKDSRNKTKGYVEKNLQQMVDVFLKDKNKVLVTVFKK